MKRALLNASVFNHHSGLFEKNKVIVWEDDTIEYVGDERNLPPSTEVIDAQGRFVTAGFIDSFTQVGLKESGIRWEGDDANDLKHEADLSVIDGVYPFDKSFREARENGITTVHITPGTQQVIGGTTALVKTGGEVIDDMIINSLTGVTVTLGEQPKKMKRDSFQFPLTRMGIASMLRDALRKVQYSTTDSSIALQKVMRKQIPLFVRCYRADDIMTALRINKEFDINMIIVHAIESDYVLEKIKEANVPVIAGPFFQDRSRYELKQLNPRTLKHLHDANISYVLTTDHPTSAIRNLHLEAILGLREGLNKVDLLRKLTIEPATLLNIASAYGSVEASKKANIVVWDGEPLELYTRALMTIIDGDIVYDCEQKGANMS